MIDYCRLATMDTVELADIIFTLELCYRDAMKDGATVEFMIAQSEGEFKVDRDKIAGYMRAKDLAKIIKILGGKSHDNDQEK